MSTHRTMQEIDESIKKLESYISGELGRINENLINQLAEARIRELESDLADALNPVSSRMGALTHLEGGVLSYRINGMFVPVSEIANALKKVGHPCMESPDGEKS